jgi:hypothetical protein
MALTYGKQSPQEMLAKAERDLAHLEAAEAAQKRDELSDALFNLAVSLTSVKDWLKEQTNAAFTPASVESYVSASAALSSFRDIANEGKHRVIRKYVPTTRDVMVSATFVILKSLKPSQLHASPGLFRLKIIRADGSRHRAVQLGRVAIQEWQSFMRQYGLIAFS